jgi:hypothetical protein
LQIAVEPWICASARRKPSPRHAITWNFALNNLLTYQDQRLA